MARLEASDFELKPWLNLRLIPMKTRCEFTSGEAKMHVTYGIEYRVYGFHVPTFIGRLIVGLLNG
jgi:hypothetical protein